MLFGFAVVPYTTPNAASSPKRTNTWSPPPRAAVAPVSSTSWLLISVPDRAAGADTTTPMAVAASRSTMTRAFACMEQRASSEDLALEGGFQPFAAIVNVDFRARFGQVSKDSGKPVSQRFFQLATFVPGVKTRVLGRTGLTVSEIGFGAWALGGNAHGNSYGPTDDAESVAALRRAIELGVNFIDTADVYGWGHSEEILGEALQNRRDDVHIATKVGGDFYHGGVRMNFDPGYIAFALQRSLKRLRTDHVDVYQLHNPRSEEHTSELQSHSDIVC